jgi:NH3-dependent NAD+ synthetase
LIDWIGRAVEPATGRGTLVPVSGGSDSALCFWLCARALPAGRTMGLYVGSSLRCRAWFESVGTLITLDEPPREADVDHEVLRWAMTVTQARRHRGWVTGSRNRTEDVFGTYSLASRVCTLFPLAGLWKSQVMELCDVVGIPQEITQSSRQADPACGRPKTMADIPFSQVDLFLQIKVGERPESELLQLDENQLKYLEWVYQRNQFKRDLPLRPPVATA